MISTKLQTYLAQRGKVSLTELESHFRTDADALRGMLNRLVRKGRVRQHITEKCEGCTHCDPQIFEVYEWIGRN
jgi:putative ferrous iron transport protein C